VVCAIPPGRIPCSHHEGSAAPSPCSSAESTTEQRGESPPWSQGQPRGRTCSGSPPPRSEGKCPTTAIGPSRSRCTRRNPSACPPSPRPSSGRLSPTSYPGPSRRSASSSPSPPRPPLHHSCQSRSTRESPPPPTNRPGPSRRSAFSSPSAPPPCPPLHHRCRSWTTRSAMTMRPATGS
jgi:hypothetical protein